MDVSNLARSALVHSELSESVFEGTEIRLNVPSTNDKGVSVCVSVFHMCNFYLQHVCVSVCTHTCKFMLAYIYNSDTAGVQRSLPASV